MKPITPFLWFDDNAFEAAQFYVSVFPDSKMGEVQRFGGNVSTVSFELRGQEFTALNGGPHFRFNEAVSFVVRCKDQKEIDYYWDRLSADGGEESKCGWLKDKFGLSWQVVPEKLVELLSRPAAMKAMMKMRKLEIAALASAS